MNIAGRFQRVSKLGENPIVVGLIGKATPETLNEANIKHIKAWHGKPNANHYFIDDYPVKHNRSLYNAFMVIQEETE